MSEKIFVGNRECLSKALIASSLILYGCKLSYPILKKVCHQGSTSEKTANGDAHLDDDDEEDEEGARTDNKSTTTTNNNKTSAMNGNLKCYPPNGRLDGAKADKKCAQNDRKTTSLTVNCSTPTNGRKITPGFDREFIIRLYKLIKLMVPSVFCKETGLLFVHTCALSLRTFMSIYVASMEGLMVKFIVRKDVRSFALMLLKWLAVAVPATFINSMIRYLECKLALAFR